MSEREDYVAAQAAIASLCGLVLRRLQDISVAPDATADDTAVTIKDLARIFGEALDQYSL